MPRSAASVFRALGSAVTAAVVGLAFWVVVSQHSALFAMALTAALAALLLFSEFTRSISSSIDTIGIRAHGWTPTSCWVRSVSATA